MTPVRKAGETEVQHLANIVRDNSTVLQALQLDMHHATKLLDKLVLVAEKQTEMAGSMKSQGDSIDRAFRAVDGYKSEFSSALRELTDVIAADRKTSKEIGDTVVGYRASLKTLYMVAGVAGVLAVTLASLVYTTLSAGNQLAMGKSDVLEAKIERAADVLAAKIDRDRITDNLIATEHNARLVRLESKGDEVAP